MNPAKCHSVIYVGPSLIYGTFKACKTTPQKAGFKESLSHAQTILCKGAGSAASKAGGRERNDVYRALKNGHQKTPLDTTSTK